MGHQCVEQLVGDLLVWGGGQLIGGGQLVEATNLLYALYLKVS